MMSCQSDRPNARQGARPDKTEWTAYYHSLLEAFGQPGCPICRLLAESADKYIDGVLWEMVLDLEAREEINDARGYCPQHGWLLHRVGAALGTAILTRGVLKTLLDVLASCPIEDEPESVLQSLRQRLGRKQIPRRMAFLTEALGPKRLCPVCTHLETVEEHVMSTLMAHLVGPDGLAEVYHESDGLCLAHFRQTLVYAPSSWAARALIAAQETIWQRLYDELGEFIRKKDYKHKGEAFGPEKDAWLRALAAVSGPSL